MLFFCKPSNSDDENFEEQIGGEELSSDVTSSSFIHDAEENNIKKNEEVEFNPEDDLFTSFLPSDQVMAQCKNITDKYLFLLV